MPQPDRIDGAPHPRDALEIFGQDTAQSEFLDARSTGRLHHAWLLCGPRGVGKATLAWTIARFLLTTPEPGDNGLFGAPDAPNSLHVAPDHPVARRIAAGSEPGLKAVTRTANDKGDRLSADIRVKDIRALGQFFQLSAADGGRRVVIVDAADEMNTQAANALLKMLEEPPERATLLLVSHQPSRLLPTIRSRCRTLRLNPLGPQDMARAFDQAGVHPEASPEALAELSGGSVGDALRLSLLGGLDLYAEVIALLAALPRPDRPRGLRLAEAAAARGGEARRDLLFALIDLALARLARTGAAGAPPVVEATPGEAEILARLAPGQAQGRAWANLSQEIGARVRHGLSVNLDPAALVLDTLLRIQKTAAA
ncbi:DNA polymerase III subunit delta' [Sulfitobacter sp. D35]|uniref:DNA polymerase III subunit delta' n=1 Tax=Sulfitobacter sp. D35 TaxID=3083252 RepID=UPI00296ED372|nr:DNA polymerase III subunit delta' [Sulfitobacter sp. D35]MDW4499440.1 DNA polymerase III subunit delta' [Sulfitobacter sp. D35]